MYNNLRINMMTPYRILFSCLLFITLACGKDAHEQHPGEHQMEPKNESITQDVYYCSMHPDVQQAMPGNCPICGMDLVIKPSDEPQTEDDHEGSHDHDENNHDPDSQSSNAQLSREDRVFLASHNVRNLELETDVVKASLFELDFKLPGRVELDPRRSVRMSSYVEGRLDELFINFEGAYVDKGDIVATIYSPEMINAQQELITLSNSIPVREGLIRSSMVKLQRLGMSDEDIEAIKSTGVIMETIPLRAPSSGYVHGLKVLPEQYMQRGESLFLINDHRQLWLVVEAYEYQLPYLKVGQQISWEFTQHNSNSFLNNSHDEVLSGSIEYISPELSTATQTAAVRLTLDNLSANVRPNQLLVGHLQVPFDDAQVLTIPYSAIMWTGEKSFVYVSKEMDSGSYYELREVVTGPHTDGQVVIFKGLSEGERVVSQGTFMVDAAAQLSNKPSMIQNNDLATRFIDTLDVKELVDEYLELKNYLVIGELTKAVDSGNSFLGLVNKNLDMAELNEVSKTDLASLHTSLQLLAEASDLTGIRTYFVDVSNALVHLAKQYPLKNTRYIQFCPMANAGDGAYWLSEESEIRNPYYGDMMLRCGETIEQL